MSADHDGAKRFMTANRNVRTGLTASAVISVSLLSLISANGFPVVDLLGYLS